MSGWTVPGYDELGPLGSGATGKVVAAVHTASGTRVAIKYLSPRLRQDQEFLDRFRAEASLLAGLSDPHVVRFYEYRETATDAALVMELVDGVTLRTLMQQTGPLTPEAALLVMRGSLLGLAAAHAVGIVHRDYKPANVLIDPAGTSKLADFGIAERAGSEMPAVGTPNYMAPEQWEGAPAAPASDIYATTATFFQCLTGRVPFSADTLFELEALHREAPIPLDAVPPEVQPLVAHGLAKDVSDRPHDAAAFVAELEVVAGAAYGEEWERRGRKWLALAVGALAALFPLALLDGGLGAGAGAGGFGGPGTGAAGGTGGGGLGQTMTLSLDTAAKAAKKSAKIKAAIAAAAIAVVGGAGVAIALNTGSGGAPAPGLDPTSVAAAAGTATSAAGGAFPNGDASTADSAAAPAPPTGTTTGTPSSPTPTKPKGTGAPTGKQTTNPPTGTVLPPPGGGPTMVTNPPVSSAPPPTTPVVTPTPPPLNVSVTVVGLTTSWSGTCPPPSTATSFAADVSVTGTVTSPITVTLGWHLDNGGDSGANRTVTLQFSGPGTQRSVHNESTYAGIPAQGQTTQLNDHAMVDWSVSSGGALTTSNKVPFTITCTTPVIG